MQIQQVFKIMDQAVIALVSSDAPLRQRLEAALEQVFLLTEKDFPPDCRKDFGLLKDLAETYRVRSEPADLQPQLALAIYNTLKSLARFTLSII